jgi:hypothetical protein
MLVVFMSAVTGKKIRGVEIYRVAARTGFGRELGIFESTGKEPSNRPEGRLEARNG